MSCPSVLLRRLYTSLLNLSAHPRAAWFLAAVSFAESSFFPLPPDILLIPLCLARRQKAFQYALLCTIASVLGGLVGYAIGFFAYETWGQAILKFYGQEGNFLLLKAKYDAWGGWILFAKGLTPFPYKVLTVLSGVLHLRLDVFIVSSLCSRALRFFLVATLLWKYGAPAQRFIERHLTLVTTVFLILLMGGFFILKYLL